MMSLFGWIAQAFSWVVQFLKGNREADEAARARDAANAQQIIDQYESLVNRLQKQLEGFPAMIAEFQRQRDHDKEMIFDLRAKLQTKQLECDIAILKSQMAKDDPK